MPSDNLSRLKPLAEALVAHLAEARKLHAEGRPKDAHRAEEAAGRLMCEGPLAAWLLSVFRRRGIPHGTAEELAMEVWRKLIAGRYEVRTNAFALLARMARSRLVDHLRARRGTEDDPALRAGPAAEGDTEDSDDWIRAFDRLVGGYECDYEQRQCVHRKLAEFAAAEPAKGELLMMVAEGLTAKEIAHIVLKKALEEVSKKDEGAMRDRIYQARKRAIEYFKECKE